ncbi:MAG: hypothetical protein LAT66_06705 [Alkalimonas sp.]|nr:hypothetical protein [Alkalimonas sp.]
MSVINQMLRDLEQRQPKHSASTASEPVVATGPASPQRRWLIIVLLIVIMSGLVWLWVTSGSSQAEPEAVELHQSVVSVQTLATELEPVEAEAAPAPQQSAAPLETMSVKSNATALTTSESADTEVPAQQAIAVAEADSGPMLDESDGREPVLVQQVEAITDPVKDSAASMRVERVELTHQQQIARMQQQAYEAEQRGQAEQARQRWQQLMALEPTLSEPYIALAHAAQLRANEAGVQYWLQLALEQGVDSVEVHKQLAASFARQQLWAEALQHLAQIPVSAMNLESRALQATAWQQLGQHQQALTGFEWLAQQQPQQARWWLGMALSHDALGHTEQALSLFGRSLQLEGNLNPATVSYIQQRIQDLN